MDSQEIPRLIYLVILLVAVGGWFFAENRQSLGKSARMLLAWGLIFLGIMAGYGLWEDVRRDVMPRQSIVQDGSAIEVPRGPGGHFYLTVNVAGTPVSALNAWIAPPNDRKPLDLTVPAGDSLLTSPGSTQPLPKQSRYMPNYETSR